MGGLGLDMDDKDDVSFFFWSYSELQDALRLVRAAANDYVLYLSMSFWSFTTSSYLNATCDKIESFTK